MKTFIFLCCMSFILGASQPADVVINNAKDFSLLEKKLTNEARDKLQSVADENGWKLEDNDMYFCKELTDFQKSTGTAACTVIGSYEYHNGDYCSDAECNSICHRKSSCSVKISESQFKRLNWYGCTVS